MRALLLRLRDRVGAQRRIGLLSKFMLVGTLNRHGIFPRRVRVAGLRTAAFTAALLYLSLTMSFQRWPGHALAGSGTTVPEAQAMPVSGEVEANAIHTAGPMAESGHACCCKHQGKDDCEMGCCHASAIPEPGAACYRACGSSAAPSALAFVPDIHVAPSLTGYLLPPFSVPARPGTVLPAFRFIPAPPEKVPIG